MYMCSGSGVECTCALGVGMNVHVLWECPVNDNISHGGIVLWECPVYDNISHGGITYVMVGGGNV